MVRKEEGLEREATDEGGLTGGKTGAGHSQYGGQEVGRIRGKAGPQREKGRGRSATSGGVLQQSHVQPMGGHGRPVGNKGKIAAGELDKKKDHPGAGLPCHSQAVGI